MPNTGNAVTLSVEETTLIHSMQVLGDPTRYKIFKLLQGEAGYCVSEIAEQIGISMSAVSQHFRQFEILGLVHKQRDGQKICYRLNQDNTLLKAILSLQYKEA